jgi:FtsZ-binding cell division protein ZapB
MKKTTILLAGASMLALGIPALTIPANAAASGPFADVPADHWAYQSVDTLQKAGIVIGYPDGTYGGKRAMTRYEFAVAIARLLPLLNSNGNTNGATKDDLAALRQDLEQKLQANSDAIDALTKLVDEFQPELQRLGQDVAAVKARLDALDARVAAVEEEQRRVRFWGDLNVIAEAANVTKGASGAALDENGNPIDAHYDYAYDTYGSDTAHFLPSSGGAPQLGVYDKHLLGSTSVYNDFLLTVKGKISDTATANVKLDFGDYLSTLGDVASPGGTTTGFSASNANLYEAYLNSPVSLGPLGGASLWAGRFPNQETAYTLRQVDADVYTSLYQTDSGNIETDGAKVNFRLGPVGLATWAGKFDSAPYNQPYAGSVGFGTAGYYSGYLAPGFGYSPTVLATFTGTPATGGQYGARPGFWGAYSSVFGGNPYPFAGGTLNPYTHASPLNDGAGLRATIGNSNRGVLGFTVEQFGTTGAYSDPNRPGHQFDRVSVYGADFNGAFPIIGRTGLTLNANYDISAQGYDNGFNDAGNNFRYTATDDQIGYTFGALSIKGGYQYVGPEYSAPGYWGRVGDWSDPTNVRGGVVSGKYVFGPKLSLDADYEGYTAAYGTEQDGSPINSPLGQGDKLSHYRVGLGYGLSSKYAVDLGYEESDWNLKNAEGTLNHGGDPKETYITLGLGHSISQNASFKFTYQIDQYSDKGTGFDGPVGDTTGNIAVGQFALKF